MVLQQGGAQIWGHATSGSRVSVQIDTGTAGPTTTADAEGVWRLQLPSPAGNEAQGCTLRFKSSLDPKVSLNLTDVLFGDVWVCS